MFQIALHGLSELCNYPSTKRDSLSTHNFGNTIWHSRLWQTDKACGHMRSLQWLCPRILRNTPGEPLNRELRRVQNIKTLYIKLRRERVDQREFGLRQNIKFSNRWNMVESGVKFGRGKCLRQFMLSFFFLGSLEGGKRF